MLVQQKDGRKIKGGLFEELSASRPGREDFTTPSFLHIVHFDWNLIERVQNILKQKKIQLAMQVPHICICLWVAHVHHYVLYCQQFSEL